MIIATSLWHHLPTTMWNTLQSIFSNEFKILTVQLIGFCGRQVTKRANIPQARFPPPTSNNLSVPYVTIMPISIYNNWFSFDQDIGFPPIVDSSHTRLCIWIRLPVIWRMFFDAGGTESWYRARKSMKAHESSTEFIGSQRCFETTTFGFNDCRWRGQAEDLTCCEKTTYMIYL